MGDFKRLLTLIVLFQTCATSFGFIIKYLHKYGEDFATSFVLPAMICLIILTNYLFKKLNGEADNTKIWNKIIEFSIFALSIFYFKLLFVDFLKHMGVWIIPVSVIIAFSLRVLYRVEDEKNLDDEISGKSSTSKGLEDKEETHKKYSIFKEKRLIQLHLRNSDLFRHFFEQHWQKVSEVEGESGYTVYGLGQIVVRFSHDGMIEGQIDVLMDIHDAIAEESGFKLDDFKGILDEASKNILSWTPLTYASGNGDLETVKYLCNKGVDLNHKDEVGKPPLMHAVRKSDFEIIQLLVKSGANVNQYSNSDQTALMAACNQGDLEIAKFLLENGADRDLKRVNGWTAAEYAKEKGNEKLYELVKKQPEKKLVKVDDEIKYEKVTIQNIPGYLKDEVCHLLRLKEWGNVLDERGVPYFDTFSKDGLSITFSADNERVFKYEGPEAELIETDYDLIFRIPDIDLEVSMNKHSISEKSTRQEKDALGLLIENSSKKDTIGITLELPVGMGIHGMISSLEELSWETEGKSRVKSQVMGIYGSQYFRKGTHSISIHMSDYTDEITIHGKAIAIRKALLEVEAAKEVDFSSTYAIIERILKDEVTIDQPSVNLEFKNATVRDIPVNLKDAVCQRLEGWQYSGGDIDEKGGYDAWDIYSKDELVITFSTRHRDESFFEYEGPEAEFLESDKELTFKIPEIDLEVLVDKPS